MKQFLRTPDEFYFISNFPAQIQILSWDKTKENFCPVSLSETDFERFSLSLQFDSKAVSMNHLEKKWLRVSKSLKSLNMLAGESVCCELRSWAYRAFKDKFSEEEFFLSNYQNDETDPKMKQFSSWQIQVFVQWSSLEDEQDA